MTSAFGAEQGAGGVREFRILEQVPQDIPCPHCGSSSRLHPVSEEYCAAFQTDLDRIAAEQQAAAQLLQDGHEDQRGLRQACDDWLAAEALVRGEGV